MSITIFTITHKPFTPPPDPMYVPLHVGRAGSKDLGFLSDDTGDSISELNPYFCELTGIYWIWKNIHDIDYVGICHYRRYPVNTQNKLFTGPELMELLDRYDIITSKMLTLPGTYYEGFGVNHHSKDIHTLETVIREKHPQYLDTYLQFVHSPYTYFGNIFITSKKNFNAYCTWLFDILFEVYRRTDFTGYDGYQKRLLGFLSEMLQTVWIHHHNLSVYDCMIGMVGSKHETEEIKKKLSIHFLNKDYSAAKKCFMDTYQKRPDILMEASDIGGELRLCMQIISTCEFEQETYGYCILDKYQNYKDLICHFHTLNTYTTMYTSGHITTDEWNQFINQPYITPISVEIAQKINT